MEDINYASVEETRPPLYTAMKYWGKKPHNIWHNFIENYTNKKGVYLDPFSGSGISVFEAVKANRKAVSFDLNPLNSFIIEVFSTKFEKTEFEKCVDKIINKISQDKIYLKYFSSNSLNGKDFNIVQSFKWDNGKLYELGVVDVTGKKEKNVIGIPNELDHEISNEINDIHIPYWFPQNSFPTSPSFTASFINSIGGNDFSFLWTKRNLYVLAMIYDEILNIENIDIKKQLLFGFIQSIHLCTKMSVPRRESANRPFSTSWGRSAYLCSSRQMEMNPLLVFKGSCFGKQSVSSALSEVKSYLGKIPKIKEVSISKKDKGNLSGFDIKYGVVDINNISDYLDENSIDFIMTDPPYGGLVQYLDLSSVWLCWLSKYDNKYIPNYDAEITVKKNILSIDVYKNRFTNGMKQLYKVLKKDGKIVFTFHNKDIQIWNAFLNSIVLAGFKIEKVIHQQNRRTGESNVANPYGTSASDFYIRCIKSPHRNIRTEKDNFEHYVLINAIQIIAERNEPTPYQILFNGLLAKISIAGFDLDDFDTNVEKILSKELGNVFIISDNNNNNAGKYWWFKNPKEHIQYPDKKLSERVEDTIISLLRAKTSVTLDEVLAKIFIKYPNGLTPEIKSINSLLNKYATKSGGKWLFKTDAIEVEFTKHTEILYDLINIGKKIGFDVFVGKREQPEPINGTTLSSFATLLKLDHLKFDYEKTKRLEMIDMIWIKDNKIVCAIEVENSTNFTSGIQRASNLSKEIKKIMVLPDYREKEMLNITDLLFTESFKSYNWKYINYTDVKRLSTSKIDDISKMDNFLKNLK